MRNFTLAICLSVLSVFGICQTPSVVNFEDLCLYEFSVENIENFERAKYMDKLITLIDDVFFCNIDFLSKKGTILAKDGFDISLANEKMSGFGYSVSGSVKIPFDEKIFFTEYVNARLLNRNKGLNDQPELIKTGNPVKDEACYKKALEIWHISRK